MVRCAAGRLLGIFSILNVWGAPVRWDILSGKDGSLPLPSSITAAAILPGDFNGDGTNDLVFAFREKAPALVLMTGSSNRVTLPVEIGYLMIAGTGSSIDLDRDQDLDLVFGTAGGAFYWWENPAPNFNPGKSWVRHEISPESPEGAQGALVAQITGGANHLVLARAHEIVLAPIPSQVRQATGWTTHTIHTAPLAETSLHAADVDIDGIPDLIAGNAWFKHKGATDFTRTVVAPGATSLAPGRFQEGSILQFASWGGDKLSWHDCKLDPDKMQSWSSRNLLSGTFTSVQIGDLDLNGHDDILAITREGAGWIFYADGDGNFEKTTLPLVGRATAVTLADLNNDGTLDLAVASVDDQRLPQVDLLLNQGGTRPRTRPYLTNE